MADVMPGSGASGADKAALDDLLVRAAQQSTMAGDAPGSIPGDLERLVHKLTNPVVPWNRILAGFFTKLSKVDYSFRKPNRRFFTQGILMPSMTGEKLCRGAIGVDTSGSILDEPFQDFVSEAAAIVRNQNPEMLHFIQFDTRIKRIDVIETLQI